MDDDKRNRKRIKIAAIYATLPFVLGIPPIVGWYIGSWFDQYFETTPYGMFTFLALGIVAGAREFYHIVTKYKDNNEM